MFHEKRLIFREVDLESRSDEPIPLSTAERANPESFHSELEFDDQYVNCRALLETFRDLNIPDNQPLGLDYQVDNGYEGQLVPLGTLLLEAKSFAERFSDTEGQIDARKKIIRKELMVVINTALDHRAIVKADLDKISHSLNQIMDDDMNWAWAQDLDAVDLESLDNGLDEGEGEELAA